MKLTQTTSGLLLPVVEKTWEQKRDEALKAYYAEHEVCPQCFGEKGWQTCMGYIWQDGTPYYDGNHTHCTECDWEGRIDDLVRRPEATS